MRTKMRKTRPGARGMSKVRSGCQTCKIRHKKCDEIKPSCSPCSSTGRRCDFSLADMQRDERTSQAVLRRSLQVSSWLPSSPLPDRISSRSSFEVNIFDYFRLVCAKEFSLFFESPVWEGLVLRIAHVERSIYHAALAISALTRSDYSAMQVWYDPGHTSSASEYALVQYNLAIQCLNTGLDGSAQSIWLAILGSIVFITVEYLRGEFTFTSMHLQGGLALIQTLKSMSHDTGYLEDALHYTQQQLAGLGW